MIQKINKTLILPYSTEKIYSLVKDVNSYYLFLPFCSGSRIIKSKKNYMIASIDIVKFGVKYTFTTRNTLNINKSIKINLIDGPFVILEGCWNFITLKKKKSLIIFKLEFELFNIFFKKITNKLLKNATNLMLASFSKRAKDIF